MRGNKGRNRGRSVAARAAGLIVSLLFGVTVVGGARVAGAANGTRAGVRAQAQPPDAAPTLAFDTCEAPSLEQMGAWRAASPYRSVAIYIGGEARACRNAALDNAAWVNGAFAQGWGVIPVYVGPQAPCSNYRAVIDVNDPGLHGFWAGLDASMHAIAAGIPKGSPIYLDVEPWQVVDGGCDAVVAAFLDRWVWTVRQWGFEPGLYSTMSTGIRVNLESAANPAFNAATALWIASWNHQPGNLGAGVPSDAWDNRRIHQYEGDHDETWGGVTINVDSNWVDGPVATPPPPPPPPAVETM
jgi:hypothetical protein